MIKTELILGLWKKHFSFAAHLPDRCTCCKGCKKIRLIKRKQVDWLAAIELTEALRKLDKHDPVKYDLALFNLGVIEKF
jgi:hypothetical protein